MYAIPRRKQNGGRSGKRHRPISLLESALIFKKKMQEFTHVVRMERIFFMCLEGMQVRRFPFCTIKKTHNICSSTKCVLLNILLPMK